MNGFVAIGATPTDQAPITSGAFWPAVDPDDALKDKRIDGTVTPPRLRAALIDAIATVNHDLAGWMAAQIALGFDTLAEVPAPVVDDESIHVHRYRRAVYCLAAADLTEQYRSFDATDAGHQYADKLETPIGDLRRAAHWALRDIRGEQRTTVDLI
ncbi:head completion/stabilization protein [Methyloversatilis sp.]|uniref:head completion/stabilization protein n=1 Tax=Methyloversatilis sp. TaxID=2569862 RepID=UPI002735CE2E|nr:head completion/stabilization protein [Methyloversatilis sp.]MDP3579151.1 head completion/stabilization protein [Methyloversatilis sp.]